MVFRVAIWLLTAAVSSALVLWGVYRLRLANRRRLDQSVGRRTSELCEAARRAEHADRLKSEFLAMMSHEIRTPLNALLGMTHLVLGGELPPGQRERMEIMRGTLDSAVVLLNNLLDLSKIEAGRLPLAEAPFSLRACVRGAAETFAGGAESKGLELGSHVAGDLPDKLAGDAVRLRQVLLNLLSNAVRFTERGRVHLEVKPAPGGSTGDTVVQFVVSDTGTGIPAARQAVLKDMFAHADANVTGRSGGAGLGLAISNRLVAMMGGRMWIESKAGEGSAFSFSLRFPRIVDTTMTSGPETRRNGQEFPVLLVDDNAVNRQVISSLLAERGHHVRLASNGLEAVEQFREGVGLVLMDLRMPEMDGLAATMRIRQLEKPGGPRVPVIAMTAKAMPGDREKCLAAGMDDYIAKPFHPEELIEKIESYIGEARNLALNRTA
jgi:signal transduction histidine kinase/ActR/RegA family two-component response regulator